MRGSMRLAGVGVAACGAWAGADEIVTTFGNDWIYAQGWEIVGQTLTVPVSNVLESYAVAIKGELGPAYPFLAYVTEWDAEAGEFGDILWSELAWGEGTELQLFQFTDIDLHLVRGGQYAIAVALVPGGAVASVAVTDGDVYAGGLALTRFDYDSPLFQWSANDMLFTASFTSCPADVNGDGELNIFDFIAFQGLFTQGSMKADFNADGMLNVLDFVAFQAVFIGGCGGA